MNKIERAANKKKSVDQYKEKWGLGEYKVFAHGEHTLIFCKDGVAPSCASEIRNLDTLLNRMKNKRNSKYWRIIVYEDDGSSIEFDSKDELLHYTMIKKISGV